MLSVCCFNICCFNKWMKVVDCGNGVAWAFASRLWIQQHPPPWAYLAQLYLSPLMINSSVTFYVHQIHSSLQPILPVISTLQRAGPWGHRALWLYVSWFCVLFVGQKAGTERYWDLLKWHSQWKLCFLWIQQESCRIAHRAAAKFTNSLFISFGDIESIMCLPKVNLIIP